MSLIKVIRNSLLVLGAIAISYFAVHAQTGNTGGSSGGTGGGQHGEGSGPGIDVPGTGGVSFSGDPDANPYTTPTPHDITAGVVTPAATPKHGKSKGKTGHDNGANVSPTASPAR